MSNNVKNVLTYLADSFQAGRSYSSINVSRSMLSMTLSPVDERQVGQHPLVVKLLKGCFNLRPPKPKYTHTWDPDIVFDLMRREKDNEELDLDFLSGKLATLLALATLLRVSELASIDRNSIKFTPHDVSFQLSKLRKTQSQGPLLSITLPTCAEKRICPVNCLGIYVYKTDVLRPNSNKLFLTLIAPYRPVTGSTIGRWVKPFLAKAGVDTTVFSAHSTRGAAASKAVANGVPTDAVMRAAHWAKESTFAKYYHRSTQVESVASSVLGLG